MGTKFNTQITTALHSAISYFSLDVNIDSLSINDAITILDRLYRAGTRGNTNCCSSCIQDTLSRYAREAKEALVTLGINIW